MFLNSTNDGKIILLETNKVTLRRLCLWSKPEFNSQAHTNLLMENHLRFTHS